MCIAAVETAEEGGNIANLMFSLILIFCGVLAGPKALPGFWIFMYYLSPFTYLASAMLSTGVANTKATCLSYEYLHFDPPGGQTCGQYLTNYIAMTGGYVENPSATTDCSFCSISDTNVFLAAVNANYADRWRNFGFMWVYIIFNIIMALFLYWLVRVPKKNSTTKELPPPIMDKPEAEDRSSAGGRENADLEKSGALQAKEQIA
jgi:ATP-binding cassette, subfamily G (WHITE), member 2, PDR